VISEGVSLSEEEPRDVEKEKIHFLGLDVTDLHAAMHKKANSSTLAGRSVDLCPRSLDLYLASRLRRERFRHILRLRSS
jgi:hypothetical protein